MGEPQVKEAAEGASMGALEAKVIEVSKPRPETIVRHLNFRKRVKQIAMLEKGSNPNADVFLAEQLDPDTEKERQVLTDKEKDDYGKFIDKVLEGEDVEKKSDLRVTVMQQIFRPKKFADLHSRLHKEYEKVTASNPEFAAAVTEEDYILEKAAQFVREARALLMKARTRKVLDSASGQETDVEKEKERRDKIDKEIQQFVDTNEEALIDFEKQGEGRQKQLLDSFVQIFMSNGCKEEDRALIENLFHEIVSDAQFAVLTSVELEATLPEMIKMVQEGVTDEDEWNARRKKALEQKAPELLEQPKEQGQPVYVAGLTSGYESTPVSYTSVGEMAHSSGVNLRPAPGKGPDVYEVHSEFFGGRYRPLVRIVYHDKSSRDINDADIYIQDEWVDKGKADDELFGKAARKYTAPEFREAVNKQILEYEMNVDMRLKLPTTKKESVNDILTDVDMMHMAERLFGFSLNSRALEGRHVELYRRFITVLMREEAGEESLVKRKKTVMEAVNDDSKIAHIRAILAESEGRKTMTAKALIDEVDIRMKRDKKKKES